MTMPEVNTDGAPAAPAPSQELVRFIELDNLGLTMYSRWRSYRGSLTVLVYRDRDLAGNAVEIHILDVDQEYVVKCKAADVVKWIREGKMTRVK